jgi:hypothetical protein
MGESIQNKTPHRKGMGLQTQGEIYTGRVERDNKGNCDLDGDLDLQFGVHECSCDVVPLERSALFPGVTLADITGNV